MGSSTSKDLAMIRDAGFVLENPDESILETTEDTSLNVEFKKATISSK